MIPSTTSVSPQGNHSSRVAAEGKQTPRASKPTDHANVLEPNDDTHALPIFRITANGEVESEEEQVDQDVEVEADDVQQDGEHIDDGAPPNPVARARALPKPTTLTKAQREAHGGTASSPPGTRSTSARNLVGNFAKQICKVHLRVPGLHLHLRNPHDQRRDQACLRRAPSTALMGRPRHA